MEAKQAGQAFASIEQFRHTPCRECRSRQTVPLICQGVVIVSCEKYGGATRKGRPEQSAPATGYGWQESKDEPDALVCRKDGAPPPSDKPSLLSSGAPDPQRRQYP
ncbi:hypothetical protein ABT010_35820 [Streptomyces sp. NPDC002668]|uniref:hypothetical protein n=1 Tax=Streptomyces sp. NPDC002668 TaxID=3154422 RepID=UPI00332FBE35